MNNRGKEKIEQRAKLKGVKYRFVADPDDEDRYYVIFTHSGMDNIYFSYDSAQQFLAGIKLIINERPKQNHILN